MSRSNRPVALVFAAVVLACADSSTPTALSDPPSTVSTLPTSPATPRLESFARRFALALANPVFRAHVKDQLDRSPIREHKIHLQRFLEAAGRQGLREVARLNGEAESAVEDAVRRAGPLEVYLPVPEHRRKWNGDEHILVATAAKDGEIPVAFDLRGGRHFLSPERPPQTPVLAVVPVETDFDRVAGPAGAMCYQNCGGGAGGGTSAPPPGLYMTYAHFVDDFEGWLKGSPEFEIHIMGQAGSSDSLTRYQCAGEHANGFYNFDQNGLDWAGSVLLFNRNEIDTYKAQHPGQSFRVIALEDDDTACQLKVDQNRWLAVVGAAGIAYQDITGATDSGSTTKYLKAARSLQNFLSALASWIKSNDDLIGNAIEDKVTGEFYPGSNWVVKGEHNVTNGWIKLEIR